MIAILLTILLQFPLDLISRCCPPSRLPIKMHHSPITSVHILITQLYLFYFSYLFSFINLYHIISFNTLSSNPCIIIHHFLSLPSRCVTSRWEQRRSIGTKIVGSSNLKKIQKPKKPLSILLPSLLYQLLLLLCEGLII